MDASIFRKMFRVDCPTFDEIVEKNKRRQYATVSYWLTLVLLRQSLQWNIGTALVCYSASRLIQESKLLSSHKTTEGRCFYKTEGNRGKSSFEENTARETKLDIPTIVAGIENIILNYNISPAVYDSGKLNGIFTLSHHDRCTNEVLISICNYMQTSASLWI